MNLLVKPVTGLIGLVLLAIGIAGYFSSGTLYVLEVNSALNLVYTVSGALGLIAFFSSQLYSRWYLTLFGLIFAVITVAGFWTGNVFGFFPVNAAADYLHLVIAAVALIVGLGSGK